MLEISEQPRAQPHLLLLIPSPSFQTLSSGAECGRGALPAALCGAAGRCWSCMKAGTELTLLSTLLSTALTAPHAAKKESSLFFFVLFVPSASAPALPAAQSPSPRGGGSTKRGEGKQTAPSIQPDPTTPLPHGAFRGPELSEQEIDAARPGGSRSASFRSTSPRCIPTIDFTPRCPIKGSRHDGLGRDLEAPPAPPPAVGCLPPFNPRLPQPHTRRAVPGTRSLSSSSLPARPAAAGSSRGRDYSWMGWRRLRREALALPK